MLGVSKRTIENRMAEYELTNKSRYTDVGDDFRQGLITWRISARAEISTRLTGLKFCCDYMTNFSPGWNISLGTKYEIAREESQKKLAPRTRIVKIGALLLSQFGLLAALNFQLFGMVTAYNTRWWNWSKTCLWLHISQLERRIQRKRRYLQARRVNGFPIKQPRTV